MELAELYSQLGGIDQARNLGARAAATADSATAVAGASDGAADDAQLREVSRQFEALFIEQILEGMRKTVDTSHNPLKGGLAQDVFEDMLYREYAQLISKTGSLGIAELVYGELKGR